jgi:hypothetical protein
LGDGNCGYWAVLRSLKNLRDRNSSQIQTIGIFQTIPDNFSSYNPSQADYQLMNALRQKTCEETKKGLLEGINAIRWQFANAFQFQTSLDSSSDYNKRTAIMQMTIPVTINLQDINLSALHDLSVTIDSFNIGLYRLELASQVESATDNSLIQFQNTANNDYPWQTSYPRYYQYLSSMSGADLWLSMTEVPHLAQVLGLPLLIIYPKDRSDPLARRNVFTGEYGCYFYDDNGNTLTNSSSNPQGHTNTQWISNLLTIYPNTITIYYNGSNHYQAILK